MQLFARSQIKNIIGLKSVVIFLQEMAYFDDPLHSTGALTTALSTHASAVQGVSMTAVKTCGGSVHH